MTTTQVLVISLAPHRFATRTRKAASQYRRLGEVTFLSLQGVGRTGKIDSAGERTGDGGVLVHQVRVGRLGTAPGRRTQVRNALVVYLPAFLRLVGQVWRRPAAVVHVTGAPMIPLAWLHRRRHRSRVVLDINERPASSGAQGSLFSVFRRVEPRLLRLGSRLADVTTVVTAGHADLLRDRHGFGDVLVVRNAPLAEWRAAWSPPPSMESGLRVVTVGTVFEGRGFEAVIGAVGRAREAGTIVTLDLYGGGREDYLASLRALVVQRSLQQVVTVHGPVPSEQVSAAYLTGHVGLALYESADPSNDSLSNKLLECVSTGRPALAGDLPENRRFVTQHGVGWLSGVDEHSLAEAITTIASAADLDALAARCRALGDANLTWEAEFAAVLRHLPGDTTTGSRTGDRR